MAVLTYMLTCRKLIQKNNLGSKSPEVVEDAIQDLIDIEVEFKR